MRHELMELHRARAQLLRRTGNLSGAESSAIDSQLVAERICGNRSEITRKIMSERVYIMTKKGHLDSALDLAWDIVERARQADPAAFPTQRALYHIEDVADLWEKKGHIGAAFRLREDITRMPTNDLMGRHNALHIKERLAHVNTLFGNLSMTVS